MVLKTMQTGQRKGLSSQGSQNDQNDDEQQ